MSQRTTNPLSFRGGAHPTSAVFYHSISHTKEQNNLGVLAKRREIIWFKWKDLFIPSDREGMKTRQDDKPQFMKKANKPW